MPLDETSLITTVGDSNQNSYVTLAEAAAYFDLRLSSDTWDHASADNKVRALLMAADKLKRYQWFGNPVTTTQGLSWPRSRVANRFSVTYHYSYYGLLPVFEYYEEDVIPKAVKDAQCELALAYIQSGGDFTGVGAGTESEIARYATDGLTIEYTSQATSKTTAEEIEEQVIFLLRGLISQGGTTK
jgi:hypothetical protein